MANHACCSENALRKLETPTRNRYFYGKLLDAFHLDLEQLYNNRKRWLLNRLTVGSGVVCGLKVQPTNDGTRLRVGPGMALDRLGREIIVPAESRPIDPRQITDACGRPTGEPIEGSGTVTICLAYHECEAEPVPVLVGECETERKCACSVVHERYALLVREGESRHIKTECGLPANLFVPVEGEPGFPNVHPGLVKRVSEACPEVEGDPCVVLAQVDLPAEGDITEQMIDPDVRPVVHSNQLLSQMLICLAQQGGAPGPGPGPDERLTKITEISWTHGGELPWSDFRRLVVAFSDPVTQRPPANGRAWFIVTVEYPVIRTQRPEVTGPPGTILVQRVLDQQIGVQGKRAVFVPHRAFERTFGSTLAPGVNAALCRVVLKCNFLLGREDRPVDGDFFGEQTDEGVRTGDGIPGGDFESWFTLTP